MPITRPPPRTPARPATIAAAAKRSHSFARLAVATLLATVTSACGDPLVSGDYRGEPLAIIEGDVLFVDDVSAELPSAPLRVAVFWSTGDALQDESLEVVDSLQEQVVTTGSFPARYSIFLYTPPPVSLLEPLPGSEQLAAVGMVVLYLDIDGNQRWSGQEGVFEPLIGGPEEEVILYAPDGLHGEVVEEPLAAGFHAVVPQRDELCIEEEGERFVPLEPGQTSQLNLLVGPDIDSLLYDLDCDEVIDEWCATCPSPAQLETLCAQSPSYCAEELDHCFACD